MKFKGNFFTDTKYHGLHLDLSSLAENKSRQWANAVFFLHGEKPLRSHKLRIGSPSYMRVCRAMIGEPIFPGVGNEYKVIHTD